MKKNHCNNIAILYSIRDSPIRCVIDWGYSICSVGSDCNFKQQERKDQNGNRTVTEQSASFVSTRRTDRFNRQLHPTEEQKQKQLQAGKTPEEQYKLAAPSCALLHCADGVPDSDSNKAVLAKMQAGRRVTRRIRN